MVLHRRAIERRHLGEPGPLQEQLPRRRVERSAVDQVDGRAAPACRPAPASSETTTSGAAVRQGAPALGQERAAARAAGGGRPPRSARCRRASRPRGPPGSRTPRTMVTEQPPSRARNATAPRGSTPCAAAPRPASAWRRAPSPQSACTMSPPGVRASTCAATGPSHGPSSRAGTSHAAPSTGRSSAASLASSVATRAERKRKASTTWPIASSSSVFSPSVARPARSLPWRNRSSRRGRRAPACRSVSSTSDSADAPGWYGP